MNDERNIITRTKNYIRENLISIALVLLCVGWLAMCLVHPGLTGKTVEEIIVDSFMCMLFGISVNRLCAIMGTKKGEQTDKFIATNEIHGKKVDEASKNINRLVKWCDKENALNKKEEQTKRLNILGIDYNDFINDKIDYSRWENPKQQERIKKKVKRIKHIKLHLITVEVLTTVYGVKAEKFDYGISKKAFLKKQWRNDLFGKIFLYLALGLMTFDLIEGFSFGDLILRIVQVVIFLGCGALTYANAYSFIVDELRSRSLMKIIDLDRFLDEQKKEEKENANKESNDIGRVV